MARLLLNNLIPGKHYKVQVRAMDGQNYSLWSQRFDLLATTDSVAPAAPTGLTWAVQGTAFVADWAPPTLNSNGTALDDLKDYQITLFSSAAPTVKAIYYQAGTHFDFSLEANISAFHAPRASVTIEVRARDTSDNLSDPATAVATNAAPADVAGATAIPGFECIIVKWNANADTDLAAYEVYMSTSPGFTPGPSTLVFRGLTTTATIDTGTDYSIRYFKIRAVDVFGTGSASYATASATPKSSFGVDVDAPADPTSFTVTSFGIDSADPTSTTGQISLSWTPPADLDLAGYEIRYSITGSSPFQTQSAPADVSTAQLTGLFLGRTYYVSIRAFDTSNNLSNWVNADVFPVTMPIDTTAPSTPAAPTANVNVGGTIIQVSHNLKKSDNTTNLEPDLHHLEVHASTTTGFTPSTTTRRGDLVVIPPPLSGTPVVSVENFTVIPTSGTTSQTWFVKVIAVDNTGNKSAASAQVSAAVALLDAVSIADATITSAKIGSVNANSIIAGTGVINALDIKNTLTIATAGIVKSANYVAATTGWQLTNTTLEINGGTIRAAALRLQSSPNIINPEYADFEFSPSFYNSGKFVLVNSSFAIQPDTISPVKYGHWSLHWEWTTTSTNKSIAFTDSTPTYNQQLEPGETYIVSAWVQNLVATPVNIRMGMRRSDGTSIAVTSTVSIANNIWTRISGVLNVPTGVSHGYLYFENITAGQNDGYFYIDGIQIEKQISGDTTPSIFKPPSQTSINGSQIVTGSIQSSANTLVNGILQPQWSINTAGNAQFGNADVRGRIFVGGNNSIDPDAAESAILSGNYTANSAGWKIDSGGAAEFNSVKIRGQIPSGAALTVGGSIIAGIIANNNNRVEIGPTGVFLINRDGTGADFIHVGLDTTSGQGFFTGSVRSFDYIQGVSGWFLGTDPNDNTVVSQVADLAVIHNIGASAVYTDDLIITGNNIYDLLAAGGEGLIGIGAIGFGGNLNSAAVSTTEVVIAEITANTITGNWYRMHARGILFGENPGSTWQFRFRYTLDGSAPISSSATLPSSVVRVAGNGDGAGFNVLTDFGASTTTAMRIALSMIRIGGTGTAQVKMDDSSYALQMSVEGIGLNQDVYQNVVQRSTSSGDAGGGSSPSKHTKAWGTIWSNSYDEDGSSRAGGDGGDMYQGFFDSTHGNQRSLFGFDSSDIQSTLSGATVNKVTLSFKVKHSYLNSGMTALISSHDYASQPSTWSGARVNNSQDSKASAQDGSTYTIDITSWAAGGLKNGNIKGMGFGPGASTSNLYYGYLYGVASSSHPIITVTYTK